MPERPGHEHMQPMPGTRVVAEKETEKTGRNAGKSYFIHSLANNVKEENTCMLFQCVQVNFLLIRQRIAANLQDGC